MIIRYRKACWEMFQLETSGVIILSIGAGVGACKTHEDCLDTLYFKKGSDINSTFDEDFMCKR